MGTSQAASPRPRVLAFALGVTALTVRQGPAEADDRAVRIACAELSADDTAEVEARIQSSLLVVGSANLKVRVECRDATARVTASTGERSEIRDVALPQASIADVLVSESEAAVDALLRQRADENAAFPSEPPPLEGLRESEQRAPSAGAASAERADTSATPSTNEPERADTERAFRAGAGVLGESFRGTLAGGGRLVGEYEFGAPVVGVALGAVTLLEDQDGFSASEWHGQAFAGYRPRGFGGVRIALGFGASYLSVVPDGDVTATSDTGVTRAFGELAISRPIPFGKLVVVPSLNVRSFPWARSVNVDGVEQVRLSSWNIGLFLGALYEL